MSCPVNVGEESFLSNWMLLATRIVLQKHDDTKDEKLHTVRTQYHSRAV